MIDVKNLIFEYPTKRALHDVTCSVRKGGITALVGPNGAGKTTLIRCVVGLHAPLSGVVLLDGVDVHAHPRDCHRKMAYLSDFFGVYDGLSVRQCLAYTARTYGVPEERVRSEVRRVAEQLGIADRLGEKAGALSRGLRQRLAIAQAIVHAPSFLVLDEPASGLDPEARQALSALLTSLRDRGMTLLVSSHILSELEDYCTDMMIMHEGRVVEQHRLGVNDAEVRRMRLDLALANDGLNEALRGLPGVSNIAIDGGGLSATFLFMGDRAGQHALIKALIEKDVAVAGLREDRGGLQDAYIAHLRAVQGTAERRIGP
jgi:ABC-2 type transport system ATP-binding protein